MKKDKNSKPEEDIENIIEEENEELNNSEETIAEDNDEIELLKIENNKLKEDFLRAFADAENTKRRCQQEIEKNNKYAISSFGKALLPVADNLQRAIEASQHDADKPECAALLKGVELTQAELMKAFAKFGISKMEAMGNIFDPNFHQVIQEVEDKEKPAGTVIAELQTGYMINDRILREAMVVVSK